MQSWLAAKLVAQVFGRLNAGDPRPALWLDAPDVELTFPGESSWSGVHSGKPAVRLWLERFARVGLQIHADEVIAKGFPWRSTMCVRGHVGLTAPDGTPVYQNRYVIWGRLEWGRLKRYEVYEDTAKAVALDKWLAEQDPPAPVP
jgi:ketosteroid isomerase-like protein